MDGHPDRSSLVTLVQPLLNMSVHSYTLHCGKILLPYCANSLQWISAPLTPSAYRCVTTTCCSSFMHVVSEAAMLMTLVVQDTWTVKVKYLTTTTGRFCACGCMCIQQWGRLQKKLTLQILLTYPCTFLVIDWFTISDLCYLIGIWECDYKCTEIVITWI
jgi:hypothetical protein